jgi:hypothetical protein
MAGYHIILTLIARKADVPNIYLELQRSWTSLHDLTNTKAMFIFAGEPVRERIPTSEVLSRDNERYREELIVFSRHGAVGDADSPQRTTPPPR